MEYIIESFRHGEVTLDNIPEYRNVWNELQNVIKSITDEEIIECHENHYSNQKSISKAINHVIKSKLVNLDWKAESPIFQENRYAGQYWRLDFAKESISVEVAFNHSGVIPWNLLKPVLAGELNHVKKAIDTKVGVVICATKELKDRGGFDPAIGEYEKFLTHLNPLRDILTIPMVIVGLKAPKTFDIQRVVINGRNKGVVNRF